MKIFDSFLFNDELDMLEMRLREMENQPVYRHVIVEAHYDHQGKPKPLYYAENRNRFAQWHSRIRHVVAGVFGPDPGLDPWVREHQMRNEVWSGLQDSDPEDLVLLCDVDEIPTPLALALQPDQMTALTMHLAMFAVDWVCPEQTRISVAGRRAHLKTLWAQRDNGTRGAMPELRDAGWHFTWLGGPDAIDRKARQFCHLELQDMILKANAAGLLYERGLTWHAQANYPPAVPEEQMLARDVDGTWPVYIREGHCPPEWFRPRVAEHRR